jgi:porin
VLFGGWGGRRQAFEEAGLTVSALLTTDIVTNMTGGRRRGTVVLSNGDLKLTLETEKIRWWPGGTLLLYLLGDVGGNPSAWVGDLQRTSNIEAPDTVKLFEAWYEHYFVPETFSLLVGLHNYSADFYVLEYATPLLNSSFGIGPEVAQTNPSIFPTTALGARARYLPLPRVYILAGVYDGVPGNPENPHGTQIILRQDDGLFYGIELGTTSLADHRAARHYKLAIGAWYHHTTLEDFSGRRRSHNSGLYALGEMAVWREQDPAQGLGVFMQVGTAACDRNPIAYYLGAGLMYTGLVPRRERDVLGLAVAHARTSMAFRRAQADSASGETALEVTYQAEVGSGVQVQPDLQYVLHPGALLTVEHALVLTLRVKVAL